MYSPFMKHVPVSKHAVAGGARIASSTRRSASHNPPRSRAERAELCIGTMIDDAGLAGTVLVLVVSWRQTSGRRMPLDRGSLRSLRYIEERESPT